MRTACLLFRSGGESPRCKDRVFARAVFLPFPEKPHKMGLGGRNKKRNALDPNGPSADASETCMMHSPRAHPGHCTCDVAPGPDVVVVPEQQQWISCFRRSRRTAENVGLPSLQDLAETRPVQSAHGEMMRLRELSCETSEEAEVVRLGRLAASCSLFDKLLEVALDLSTCPSPRTCRTNKVLDDTGGAKATGCDRQLTTVVEVGGEEFEAWRPETVAYRRTCESNLLCERVLQAV